MRGSARGAYSRLGLAPVRLALAAVGGSLECFGEQGGVGAGLAGVVGPGGDDAGGPGGPVADQEVEVGPDAAFANIARALRPRGRLVLLAWQPLPANEWVAELTAALAAGRDLPAPPSEAPGPFALADPDRVRQLLTGARFTSIEINPIQAPMWFGASAGDAYTFALGLLGWMLEGLDNDQRGQALATLRATVTATPPPTASSTVPPPG